MNLDRIKALMYRYYYNFLHNLDRLADSFYWPVLDLLLWGLTFRYVEYTGNLSTDILLIMLSGLIFWQVVWRAQYEIAVNFLEELWSQNLVNMFSTPLRISEWVIGVLFLGVIKMFITITLSVFVAWILYSANLMVFGWLLVPFFVSLLIVGWWVGMIVTGFLVLFGRQIQTFAWAGVSLLAPFSAIYYPVSLLPVWAQKISALIPASYVFEGMREVLITGVFSIEKFGISMGLNLIYLFLSILFFRFCYYKSLQQGLSRLEY